MKIRDEYCATIRSPFFFLALFVCLLGMMPSGHAQEFTVSPTTPEAYQPFAITLSIFCQITINVDPYVASGAITIEAKTNTIGFRCPGDSIEAPLAAIAGLPDGTYSLAARLRTNVDPPESHVLGEIVAGGLSTRASTPRPPAQIERITRPKSGRFGRLGKA